MFVKQISIFLENVKGSLYDLMALLGNGGINLLALSIADTTGFGIVRCITRDDQVDPALALLRQGGLIAKVNDVVCVQMPHKPCGFANVLHVLKENNLSVEYCYSFCRSTSETTLCMVYSSPFSRSQPSLASSFSPLLSSSQHHLPSASCQRNLSVAVSSGFSRQIFALNTYVSPNFTGYVCK